MHEYKVRRKLHAQGGSLLVALPRLWANAEGLSDGDEVDLIFNGIVKILPSAHELRGQSEVGHSKQRRVDAT